MKTFTDSMEKFLKMIGGDAQRGLITLVIAVLIVCPLSIFFIIIPLWEHNQAQLGDWVLYAAFAAWMLTFLGGITAIILFVTRSRKRWLDGVFNPLGLTGKSYMLNWWEYRGVFNGRQVNARFYRGPTLELSIETTVKTRFGIAEADQPGLFIAELINREPLHSADPALQALRIFALDETWTTSLLVSPWVTDRITSLMKAGESWALIRQVLLQPGQLRLRLYRNKNLMEYDFISQEVREWLEDLCVVADAAEHLPPPAVAAEESRLERAARTGKASRYAVLFVLGFLLLCGASMGILLWLLVTFVN